MRRLLTAIRGVLTRDGAAWIDVGGVDEFPPGTVKAIEARGVPIAVFHTDDRIAAIGDVCPHMGASLSDGYLHTDGSVECPAHNMRFDLSTGKCSEGPMYGARVFRARVRNDRLYILI